MVELQGHNVGRSAGGGVFEHSGFGCHQVGLLGDVGRSFKSDVRHTSFCRLHEFLLGIRAVHVRINGIELQGGGCRSPNLGLEHLTVLIDFFVVEEVGRGRPVLASECTKVAVNGALEPRARLRGRLHGVHTGHGGFLETHV